MVLKLDPRSEQDVREFIERLSRMELDQPLRDEFNRIAEKAADDARSNAPVKEGTLAGSITAGETSRGEPAVVADTPYAVVMNYGGSHPVFGKGSVRQEPTRFMDRAIDGNQDAFFKAAIRGLEEAAGKVGFK